MSIAPSIWLILFFVFLCIPLSALLNFDADNRGHATFPFPMRSSLAKKRRSVEHDPEYAAITIAKNGSAIRKTVHTTQLKSHSVGVFILLMLLFLFSIVRD